MEELIPIIAIFCGCGLPALIIWTRHQRKMFELQMKAQATGDETLRREVEQLRNEVHSLRDTSMQYDMSFDTAQQRVERRVETLETVSLNARVESTRTADLRTGV